MKANLQNGADWLKIPTLLHASGPKNIANERGKKEMLMKGKNY